MVPKEGIEALYHPVKLTNDPKPKMLMSVTNIALGKAAQVIPERTKGDFVPDPGIHSR